VNAARSPASRFRSPRLAGSVLVALAPPLVLAAAALGQRQFEPLVYLPMPEDDDNSQDVAVGDVDGDGDVDLVFASFDERHRLYLNDGNGRFSDETAANMPASSDLAYSTAMGDVDGDGDLDIVFGHFGQNRLYLNDGSGTFTDVTAARMPPDPHVSEDVAMGDVDGDGDLDLVVAHRHPSGSGAQNALYLNDGSGTFVDATAARMPPKSVYSFAVAMTDVDGDGDLDLVFANGTVTGFAGEQNDVYVNDGTGFFGDETAARMPAIASEGLDLAAGDVDGDGDLDLVFANNLAQNRLYLNDGSGVFTDVTAARLPVDRDRTLGVALDDVDRDGDLDLAFGNSQTKPSKLYLNDGTGAFTDATGSHVPPNTDNTNAIALSDVDADGDPDLVFANRLQNRMFANDGTGVFADPSTHRLPLEIDRTMAVAVGDVDGDGDTDAVFGNVSTYFGMTAGSQNRLYLNDGYGFFADATEARMPADIDQTADIVLGDLDGDGDLDLVSCNAEVNRIYLNDGTGKFSDATARRLPEHNDQTFGAALGDADGDGSLDLVVANYLDPDRMYLNDGTGVFRDVTATHLPTGFFSRVTAFAFGDADGDGDLDLVASRLGVYTGAPARLYLNDGTGRFTDVTPHRMPSVISSANDVAFGDVDGDGDGDIVLAEDDYYSSRVNKLYLNDGLGFFTDVTATHMPVTGEGSEAVVMDDLDGDGDNDLVFTNRRAQGYLFLNDGSGVFTNVSSARMPSLESSEDVALGDVDGDGDLDLFLANDSQPNRLYLNVLRQLDTPYPLLGPGSEYQLDFYDRYGHAGERDYAYPLLATASANIPLAPFGTLLISPLGMVALPPVPIHQPSGAGSISLTVPNVPGVVGVSLHAQALIVQLSRARLTNAALDRIR